MDGFMRNTTRKNITCKDGSFISLHTGKISSICSEGWMQNLDVVTTKGMTYTAAPTVELVQQVTSTN